MNSKNVFVVAGCMAILLVFGSQYAMTVSSQLSSSPFSDFSSSPFSDFSSSPPTIASSSSHPHSSSHAIGFKDGCADANTLHPTKTTDLHFNRHPNSHHHSRAYLQSYAEGLLKCKNK
ncbi:MAG TPA: hypothetical protein VIY08_12845 [Candidatus Nitrosocosmicus sp.]